MKINPSKKDIISLVAMRTIMELEIKYTDQGRIESFGRLTADMRIIYTRIVSIEKQLFNSKQTRPLYMDALEIAKIVWKNVKADHNEFSIHIEPVVCGLYFDREKELKRLGLIPLQFNRTYDSYFTTSDCDLEVQSRELVDAIYEMTDKVIFDRKKEEKRGL